MPSDTYYKDHWVEIEADRLDRYEKMFVWTDAQDPLIEPAGIQPGQVVADFGCGPGYLAVELLRRVGVGGRVHALDVNEEFLRRTAARAEQQCPGSELCTHHLSGTELPLEDGSLDRVVTKNVMVYVDDPRETFKEFRRVLRKGGRVHVVDSDFLMSAVDPVAPDDWLAFIHAASHAFRTPSIGRQLYRLAREAGFEQVSLTVLARPDTNGRWMNFVTNAAGYARSSGLLDEQVISRVEKVAADALEAGTFMALNPQFMVTATA